MKKRILLADDDSAVRRMLLRVLTDEGYLVVPASNTREVLQSATAGNIDLAVLDLGAPLDDSWKDLQGLAAGYPEMPIILITARTNQVFPSLLSGVKALMEKPLDLPKLLRTISDLLGDSTSPLFSAKETACLGTKY
jgi:DNA-binding NtrC family response regulator